MSQLPAPITLPSHLYERIRQAASNSNRSPEALVIESLSLLFDETTPTVEPALLDQYTDPQLWAIVHLRLSPAEDKAMIALISESKQAALDANKQAQLDTMLKHLNHLTLIRSKALRLLKQRGHNIETYLEAED